jgi:tRNA pseudouridine38-40 synthase
MPKQRYKITIAYDGTKYAGWQVQPKDVTVQSILEKALTKMTGTRVKIHGSGRTDQGVHARGQVAHFDSETTVPVSKIPIVVNGLIPAGIKVLSARRVAPDFHARRDAKAKEYRYFISRKIIEDPFERLYTANVKRKIDVKAMRRAARAFVGRHNFQAFTAHKRNSTIVSHVRTIYHVRVSESDGIICIAVKGQGFLYKMVRSMAGCLIRVGVGDVSPDCLPEILQSCKRTAKVPTAQACGLFLWKVWY